MVETLASLLLPSVCFFHVISAVLGTFLPASIRRGSE